jgi:cation:H+ antiporter
MTELSTGAVVTVFAFASLVTWAAGLTLADTTGILDDRFGLGEALGGVILLGFAGTLPEIAITVSAAHSGDL